MFSYDKLKIVELEITNKCQAACPMCPRNIHGGIENKELKLNDWSFNDFKHIFTKDVVNKIENFTFCGNFGDPLLNTELLEILEYIKENNPSTYVHIHTNGSLRNITWWKNLILYLPYNHDVTFALDGLADTNHLYRVDTDFNKIIENAKAFIASGGNANWQFILFKHNQHQIEQAELLSKKIGFKKFVLKNTRRFTTNKFPVLDRKGNISHYLEPNTINPIPIVTKDNLLSTKLFWSTMQELDCFPINTKSIFIDANFTVFPCCILASWVYTSFDDNIFKKYKIYNENTSVNIIGQEIKDEVFELIESLGGFDLINCKKMSLKSIISSETWQKLWHNKWNSTGIKSCSLMCNKKSPFISLEEQKVKNV